MTSSPIVDITQLGVRFDEKWILKSLDLKIERNEILAIAGGSGSGKSTLLRSILSLIPISCGTIKLFGKNSAQCNEKELHALHCRWGVLFQRSALFSSLTVLENVAFPLQVHTQLNKKMIAEIAQLKIALSGLDADTAVKYPSELSGGMQKRVALARALAMDPEVLFLDEPSAGLDPDAANALDELILNLKAALGLTVVIVTHDLDTLWQVPDRVAFLGDGKVLEIGSMKTLSHSSQPLIQAYFDNPRARRQDEHS